MFVGCKEDLRDDHQILKARGLPLSLQEMKALAGRDPYVLQSSLTQRNLKLTMDTAIRGAVAAQDAPQQKDDKCAIH